MSIKNQFFYGMFFCFVFFVRHRQFSIQSNLLENLWGDGNYKCMYMGGKVRGLSEEFGSPKSSVLAMLAI